MHTCLAPKRTITNTSISQGNSPLFLPGQYTWCGAGPCLKNSDHTNHRSLSNKKTDPGSQSKTCERIIV
jgi:hypothetical protein